jgi:hypothetical protein
MRSRLIMAATAVLVGVSTAALADPPARVGRLAHIEGEVSLRSQDMEQWASATVNYPVTTGMSLWTESDARAAIQVGPSEIRLDRETELDVIRLDDELLSLRLSRGVINLLIEAEPQDGTVRIETALGRIELLQPGRYNIDTNQFDGPSAVAQVVVSAFSGAARFVGNGPTFDVRAGQAAVMRADSPDNITFVSATASPFDDWAFSRDRSHAEPETARYVSPQVTGHQDLATYGEWRAAPSYGTVWYPHMVPSGWAPYRNGHWVYVSPWGWTWIDEAPWGFAPFHYGRWVVIEDRWAWWPGAYVRRPVYAPALVVFVGGFPWHARRVNHHHGRKFGWVPLAPHEPFVPHYRTSARYVRNVNITTVNQTVINKIRIDGTEQNRPVERFANRHAATEVPAEDFTRRAPNIRTGRRTDRRDVEARRPSLGEPRLHGWPAPDRERAAVRDIQPDRMPKRATGSRQESGPPIRAERPQSELAELVAPRAAAPNQDVRPFPRRTEGDQPRATGPRRPTPRPDLPVRREVSPSSPQNGIAPPPIAERRAVPPAWSGARPEARERPIVAAQTPAPRAIPPRAGRQSTQRPERSQENDWDRAFRPEMKAPMAHFKSPAATQSVERQRRSPPAEFRAPAPRVERPQANSVERGPRHEARSSSLPQRPLVERQRSAPPVANTPNGDRRPEQRRRRSEDRG